VAVGGGGVVERSVGARVGGVVGETLVAVPVVHVNKNLYLFEFHDYESSSHKH